MARVQPPATTTSSRGRRCHGFLFWSFALSPELLAQPWKDRCQDGYYLPIAPRKIPRVNAIPNRPDVPPALHFGMSGRVSYSSHISEATEGFLTTVGPKCLGREG